ncbi:MAG: ATP-binding protein [Dysgonamonadaceae bacterium]|nr:ATP-binding protein [Dysgonamonadaceae bacterium]
MRIAVASGKGGTGKTFVATNLFKVMEHMGYQITLVDCDAEVPNDALFFDYSDKEKFSVKSFIPFIQEDKCTYCGACADICHYHAITCIPSVSFIKLMDDACHSCHACEYVCREGAIEPEWRNVGKITVYFRDGQLKLIEGKVNIKQNSPVLVIDKIIDQAIKLKRDYLILDAPPGCSCPFVHTVLQADYVILVTEPTPFGLSDIKQTIEVLRSLNISFGVLVNRADIGLKDWKDYLKKENIEILSEIPYSQKIATEYSSGNLVVDKIPDMVPIFEEILQKIKSHESSHC